LAPDEIHFLWKGKRPVTPTKFNNSFGTYTPETYMFMRSPAGAGTGNLM